MAPDGTKVSLTAFKPDESKNTYPSQKEKYYQFDTNFGHIRSFRLAASPFGLAASQVRHPPQAGGASLLPTHIKIVFNPDWYDLKRYLNVLVI